MDNFCEANSSCLPLLPHVLSHVLFLVVSKVWRGFSAEVYSWRTCAFVTGRVKLFVDPGNSSWLKYCHHEGPAGSSDVLELPEQMFIITVQLRSSIWELFWPLGSSGNRLWKQNWYCYYLLSWSGGPVCKFCLIWACHNFELQLIINQNELSIPISEYKGSIGSNGSFGDTDVSEILYWFLWEESLLLGTI